MVRTLARESQQINHSMFLTAIDLHRAGSVQERDAKRMVKLTSLCRCLPISRILSRLHTNFEELALVTLRVLRQSVFCSCFNSGRQQSHANVGCRWKSVVHRQRHVADFGGTSLPLEAVIFQVEF